jgi:hypothetical protein
MSESTVGYSATRSDKVVLVKISKRCVSFFRFFN